MVVHFSRKGRSKKIYTCDIYTWGWISLLELPLAGDIVQMPYKNTVGAVRQILTGGNTVLSWIIGYFRNPWLRRKSPVEPRRAKIN